MKDYRLIKNPNPSVFDSWRVMDHADEVWFRYYRGRYPREGYDNNKTNPFKEPVDRKPPPLRGC